MRNQFIEDKDKGFIVRKKINEDFAKLFKYTDSPFLSSNSLTSNYLPKYNNNHALINSVVYDNGGDVGIGTSTPNQKLAVVGNVSATGNLYNDGNIYLGKSARATIPNAPSIPETSTTLRTWTSATDADIDGLLTGSAFGTIIESVSAGHFVIGLRDNDDSDSFSIISQNKNQTYTKTNFVLKPSSGNVGIGTSSPQRKLHVNGTIRLEGLPTYSSNSTAIAGGLSTNDVYKTSTGELRIVV